MRTMIHRSRQRGINQKEEKHKNKSAKLLLDLEGPTSTLSFWNSAFLWCTVSPHRSLRIGDLRLG